MPGSTLSFPTEDEVTGDSPGPELSWFGEEADVSKVKFASITHNGVNFLTFVLVWGCFNFLTGFCT